MILIDFTYVSKYSLAILQNAERRKSRSDKNQVHVENVEHLQQNKKLYVVKYVS